MKKLILVLAILSSSLAVFAAGHTVTISSQNNVSCFGMSNGAATASVSGGTGPFTFNWSSGATTATATSLSAGTYTVTVTDNSDASTATATVTIMQPSQLNVTTSGGTFICTGYATTLTATASGGTPPYAYSWTPA